MNLERLRFLSPEIHSKIKAIDNTPVLSPTFESSVRGLYFVGVAAANSFGPVLRFAYGADFAARNLTRTMAKLSLRDRALIRVTNVVRSGKEKTHAV